METKPLNSRGGDYDDDCCPSPLNVGTNLSPYIPPCDAEYFEAMQELVRLDGGQI